MGKTTVATMMKSLKIPVHDADACVHDLLSPENPASYAVAAAFPYYAYPALYERKTKAINRAELGRIVFADEAKREMLEAVLHPRVQEDQQAFIRAEAAKGREIVCLDIPLLYETGAQSRVDYVVVVSAPPHMQRARVMARPNMTEEKFAAILARQMPDYEKCARADFVIKNGLSRAHTMRQLKMILHDMRARHYAASEPLEH